MTVYYLDRSYESDIRVEVEDDITPTVRHTRGSEGMIVSFDKMTSQFETQTVASFDGVKTLRQEGLSVQYKEWDSDNETEAATESKPSKQVWVNAQEKS